MNRLKGIALAFRGIPVTEMKMDHKWAPERLKKELLGQIKESMRILDFLEEGLTSISK